LTIGIGKKDTLSELSRLKWPVYCAGHSILSGRPTWSSTSPELIFPSPAPLRLPPQLYKSRIFHL